MAANKPIDLGGLKVFRQFCWLLSPADDRRIQKLIVDERRKRQNFLETRMVKGDTVPDDDLLVDEAKGTAGGDIVAVPIVSKGVKSSTGCNSSKEANATVLEPKEKKAKLNSPDMDARMALFLPTWMAEKKIDDVR